MPPVVSVPTSSGKGSTTADSRSRMNSGTSSANMRLISTKDMSGTEVLLHPFRVRILMVITQGCGRRSAGLTLG